MKPDRIEEHDVNVRNLFFNETKLLEEYRHKWILSKIVKIQEAYSIDILTCDKSGDLSKQYQDLNDQLCIDIIKEICKFHRFRMVGHSEEWFTLG